MSKHCVNGRHDSSLLRIGPLLVALAVAGCQAGATPSVSQAPSVSSSPTATLAPTVEPTPSASPLAPQWVDAGQMSVARDAPHAVTLAGGGVLVVGDDQGAELWDAETGSWTSVPSIPKPRTNFSLVALKDGRAMVIGGMNTVDQSYLSTLVFDPMAPDDGWVMVDDLLGTARTDPAAVTLPDGRVLVAGGYFRTAPQYGRVSDDGTVLATSRGPLADVTPDNVGAAMATAELWDPTTGEWTQTGPMTYARYAAAAALLSDGRVLVVGSRCTREVTVDEAACASAELYDPATGLFTLTGSLPIDDLSSVALPAWVNLARGFPISTIGSLVALPDGGAALIGTTGFMKMTGTAIRSFRYEVADGSWRLLGDVYMHLWNPMEDLEWETEDVLPRLAPMVAVLPDGRVVIAGGDVMGLADTTTSAELYDPATDSWSDLPPMPQGRAAAAAVTLADGSVLLVGGHRVPPGSYWEPIVLDSAVRLVVRYQPE